MSGKSLARAATSAFIATRHGSPRLACEKPIRYFALCCRPHAAAKQTSSNAASVAPLRRRPPPLQPDRDENDDALEDELQVCIDVVEPHGVVDDADDQDPDDGAANRTGSTAQR